MERLEAEITKALTREFRCGEGDEAEKKRLIQEMLERARLQVVTLKVHKHGGGLCTIAVPGIDPCC